jgi:hypothetical protein
MTFRTFGRQTFRGSESSESSEREEFFGKQKEQGEKEKVDEEVEKINPNKKKFGTEKTRKRRKIDQRTWKEKIETGNEMTFVEIR